MPRAPADRKVRLVGRLRSRHDVECVHPRAPWSARGRILPAGRGFLGEGFSGGHAEQEKCHALLTQSRIAEGPLNSTD
jgi:hypothetical protein